MEEVNGKVKTINRYLDKDILKKQAK